MKRSPPVLLGLSLILFSACQAQGEDPPGQATVASAAPGVSGGAPPAAILARVNGKAISAGELEQTVRIYLETRTADAKSVPADRLKSLRSQLLDSLVSTELLFQASQAAEISVPEEAIQAQLQSLRSRFSSEQEFTQYLRSQGLSVEEMKERILRNLATERLVKQEVGSKLKVSDVEIADYYQKNKPRMRRQESVKLSEIFVRLEARAGPEARSKARQKIESLLKEVRGGKDFAMLARQHSEAPDAAQGGEMGYVSRGGTLPVLSEAAFKLKVGEVSDVVETAFGYHLLRVTGKKAAEDVSLEEAKPQISNFLLQEKEREAFRAYVDKLKAGAKIEILTSAP